MVGTLPGTAYATTDEFRGLMSGFPTGVAVVTAIDHRGAPWGLTCSSLSSVTLDPPTLLVCLREDSGTLAALAAGGRFGVNLLHTDGLAAAGVFATPGDDRFARVCWEPAGGAGMPWLVDDALAFAGCAVAGTIPVGDHTIVLGEVTDVRLASGDPLLYGRRRFAVWPHAGEARR
ncbi:flavin reductase family protein [Amycolatopsis keratiniphila]|uniref:Oxidase n=1 Tax=Amycolatopsis keratiniphila TaxID=129921 RepID=R4TBX2_9PSEU|nr:flavin reductase family protein [Amycolatopsis keratiniphila]AGM07918.1 oxidase [Amycolatopsis keratiniphila]